jgi:hypothetical protein
MYAATIRILVGRRSKAGFLLLSFGQALLKGAIVKAGKEEQEPLDGFAPRPLTRRLNGAHQGERELGHAGTADLRGPRLLEVPELMRTERPVLEHEHWTTREWFYGPSLLIEAGTGDQRIRASVLDSGPPPSAMRPCVPGSWSLNPRTGTDGGDGSGHADCPARFLVSYLPLQTAGSLSASPSSAVLCSPLGVLRASVIRLLAASA